MGARVPGGTSLAEHWLSLDLDGWTRLMVRRHFDPDLGSPYWLKRVPELGFDPRDITRYAELAAFGPMTSGDLRGVDPADLVPKTVPRPLAGTVWETGGTTGAPVRVFYTEAMITHRMEWRRWSFVHDGYEPGRTWLQATPSGPHLIGIGMREIAELRGGLAYTIDMDPRWIKSLIRAGRLKEAEEYTGHVLGQITEILRSRRVHYLNTTPALLRKLIGSSPDLVAALDGVRLGGTHVSAEAHREFTAALNGGLVRSGYGNTFGNAVSLGPDRDGVMAPYVPTYPQVTMSVVTPGDHTAVVTPGQSGQLMLTVLQDGLFLPNVLERDQAVRHETAGQWPADGVANVRPLEVSQVAPEGLY
jgi:hypothetical protein